MYVTGSDAWKFQKLNFEGSNRGPKGLPELREGLPDEARCGNQRRPPFWPKKRRFDHFAPEPFAYSPGAPILMVMTVHFPFQNTYAALPANFFARVAPTPVASPSTRRVT